MTVLYPKDRLEDGLTITELSVDRSDARAYRVADGNGSSFVIVVNNGGAQNIGIEIDDSLTDMRTAAGYANTAGKTVIPGNARSIHFFSV